MVYVNFDPQIHELVREIDVMGQMKIQVPQKALEMREKRNELKEKYENLKVSKVMHK